MIGDLLALSRRNDELEKERDALRAENERLKQWHATEFKDSIEQEKRADAAEKENTRLRAALEWIGKGPTTGPGAPTFAEQAHMQAKRAREALGDKPKEVGGG